MLVCCSATYSAQMAARSQECGESGAFEAWHSYTSFFQRPLSKIKYLYLYVVISCRPAQQIPAGTFHRISFANMRYKPYTVSQ